MFQSHLVVTHELSYRKERPPRDHLTFRNLFNEMTVERDPCSQSFETLFPRPSSDHCVGHRDGRLQTVPCR